MGNIQQRIQWSAAWIACDEHRQRVGQIKAEVGRAFREHPAETGETYFQHLWFTISMALRFVYTTCVLAIHGLFPFMLKKAASSQIEQIYRIMRERVPKARRDEIDYQV